MTGQRSEDPRNRRIRLDDLLVSRGLAPSREKAGALVLAGAVYIRGPVKGAPRPGTLVSSKIDVTVQAGPSFVSRGGEKLEAALGAFGVDPAGVSAIDVGASTGGFTDCLLQHGASRVYAIDVGHGQLAWQLRQDSRVVVIERVNARFPLPVDERVSLVTVDVSFISLALVLRSAMDALLPGGRIIALVKPQFEAARGDIERGGVVREPKVRAAAVGKVSLAGIALGLRVRGVAASAIFGPKGNHEIFVLFEKP
jgi:23S rRNA (cytidine1920-2'-O)/16S rRNA (cytidine1409-2'-O)-methyltransferase